MTPPPSPVPFWERYRWLPFLMPQIVFLVLLSLGPAAPPDSTAQRDSGTGVEEASRDRLTISQAFRYYPVYYSFTVAVTVATVLAFLPAYRQFPIRVHYLSVVVGAVGVCLWIGLCKLQLEVGLAHSIGLDWAPDGRAGFNPFAEFEEMPGTLGAFLAVRFFGMVCVVAFIEEFFLRGFVMRYFVDTDWWDVSIGTLTPMAIAVSIFYAVTSHPWHEALASATWFSLVTWLVWRTRNIWDGVVAHGVTNLLLGLYVVFWEDWLFW